MFAVGVAQNFGQVYRIYFLNLNALDNGSSYTLTDRNCNYDVANFYLKIMFQKLLLIDFLIIISQLVQLR